MENERPTNSKLIGSSVFSIMFLIIGINEMVIKNSVYTALVSFVISAISLIYFIYQYKYLKKNPSEMYDDERRQFISEKSSSMSFIILVVVISILQLLIQRNIIVVESYSLLSMILGIALIINLVTYLICKYKY